MSYSDFKTLDQINKVLGIEIKGENELYTHIQPVTLTDWFNTTMKIGYTKAIRINTESARQSLIVNNVLLELGQHTNISFFLQNSFNIDRDKGLTGNPDSIVTYGDNQLYITSPVLVLVEAKKSDLASGYAQCIAEMEAARLFNEREGNNIYIIYGVVTDGALWQFLSLKNNTAVIDSYLYHFNDGSQIVGILISFIKELEKYLIV